MAVSETAFGRRYIVDGLVATPSGIVAALRTVWIRPHGTTAPRFVTAYPLTGEG